MSSNMTECKACNKEIAKGVKVCPNCGKDQRNFFARHKIITVILALIVLGGIGAAISDNKKDNIDYVDYNYGEVIKENNVVKEDNYKMPEGVEIIFDEQSIITAEEINSANPFNDAVNDVAILKITMKNNSEEQIGYNSLGFSFATHNGTQLKDFSIVWDVLPEPYNSMDAFGSGELMPGKSFTRIEAVEIPDEDSIETVHWKYDGVEFTVKLPK